MDLAQLFVESSTFAWRFLDSAERAGFTPREESITERLLVEMVEKAPGQVRVHKTTTKEEATTGADLALGIQVRPSLWLSLLIQAKKLDYRSGTYREFAKASAFQQASHLIASAARAGCAPIYLLYNGTSLGPVGSMNVMAGCTLKDLRRGEQGPAWLGESPLGCTVVDAETVKNLIHSSFAATPASMSQDAAPWECLLCPFAQGGRPKPLPWPAPSRRAPAVVESGIDVPWLRSEPPAWLAALLSGANPEETPEAPDARHFVALQITGTG